MSRRLQNLELERKQIDQKQIDLGVEVMLGTNKNIYSIPKPILFLITL